MADPGDVNPSVLARMDEVWEAIQWARLTCDLGRWGRRVLVVADNPTAAVMHVWAGHAWQVMGQITADVVMMSGDPGYALGEPRPELPDMEAAAERWLHEQGYRVEWHAVPPDQA
jgi:hypothetical protein